MERKFLNVILLGFGFMFVFTAFQTMGNIEVSELRLLLAIILVKTLIKRLEIVVNSSYII